MNHLQISSAKNQRKLEKTASVYDDGYLRVEHKNYYSACGSEKLKLTRAEFRLISILTQSAEQYVPVEVIWRHLWTEPKPLNTKSLRVYICGIRQKLISSKKSFREKCLGKNGRSRKLSKILRKATP